MRKLLVLTVIAIAASMGGCYVEDSPPVAYATVAAPAPQLAYVSPGVQVVYDYDYPVFFTGGLYYRYYGGVWYSSRWHDRGWAVGYNVPVGIRGIDRPWAYSHYRGGYAAGRGYVAPSYRGSAYRAPAYRAPARTYRPAPARAVHK
jgi:hypothetical protein